MIPPAWILWITLIEKYGIPLAFRLAKMMQAHPDGPTDEDWAVLEQLTEKTFDDYVREAEARKAAAEFSPIEPAPPPPPPPPPPIE